MLQFFVIVAALVPLPLAGLNRVGGRSGLVHSLTPREARRPSTTGEDAGWYRRPGLLAGIALVITIVLNIIFA